MKLKLIPSNTEPPLTNVAMKTLRQAYIFTPRHYSNMLGLLHVLRAFTGARIAGGREHNLRSLQPLSLYPADSAFVNNYLTTPGSPAPEVWGMIDDLGFKIEVDYQQPVAH